MIFAGGIPLRLRGQVVGAVGVSGGTGEQDQTVADEELKWSKANGESSEQGWRADGAEQTTGS